MEKYEDLFDIVGKSGDWALYSIFKNIKPSNRIKEIKIIFKNVSEVNADELTLKLFLYLMKAIEDKYLLDLVDKSNDTKEISSSDKVDEAKLKAQTEKAKIIMELYNKLPSSELGKAREFITHDESRIVNIDVPTLLKTKRAMLTSLAKWWRKTKNEEEADAIFDFLYKIPTRFKEEKNIKLEVLQEASSLCFSSSRLTREFLSLKRIDSDFSRDETPLILAIARTRNKNYKELFQEFEIMQNLQECSKGVFQFLKRTSKQISIIDSEVRKLKEIIHPTEGNLPKIFGTIEIFYSDLNTLIVLIKQNLSRHITIEKHKKEFQKDFKLAKCLIKEWKLDNNITRKYPELKIKLILNLMNKDSKILHFFQKI